MSVNPPNDDPNNNPVSPEEIPGTPGTPEPNPSNPIEVPPPSKGN